MADKLDRTISSIKEPSREAMERARIRQDQLTKPQGSLGRLEEISIRLAGIQGRERPVIREKAVIVMAGDHGVIEENIVEWPQEVTAQMVLNFLNGGAGINVLSRHAGARVVVVDMGVATDIPPHPALLSRRIDRGTKNMALGPAMTKAQALAALETGIEVLEAEVERGLDIVAAGDMGICNTTPSAAVCSVITGKPVREVTGRGTGIDEKRLEHKIRVIEKAISLNRPDPKDPIDVLCKVGGFEIAGLAGVMLGAAASGIPVVVDGFISGAAALVAAALAPGVSRYMFAGHVSTEPGHRAMMAHLNLEPILDLNMRLGEGTGAVLAFFIIEAAAKILSEMATFEEAGVSEKEE
ncbi:MAG: nicotinate-nucleotide--dimethylbenzimidazole phosphoribosyltransferase [Deltaproteobacteria bacterium]|nr:nicotinate-nucleotide--dimethylbenzimidazole phosphoribosyltransferase [Deltaproteobacteria bacterium]